MFLAGPSTTDFPVLDCRLLPTITEITVKLFTLEELNREQVDILLNFKGRLH